MKPLCFIFSMCFVSTLLIIPFSAVAQDSTGREVITLENSTLISEIATFGSHESAVNSITFSPDGTLLAYGGDDTNVHLWQVSTGQEIQVLEGHTGTINEIAFIPDGTKLVAVGDVLHVPLIVWNIPDGTIALDARVGNDFQPVISVMQENEKDLIVIDDVEIGNDFREPKYWGFGHTGGRILVPGKNLLAFDNAYDFYDVAFSPPLADSPYPDLPESVIAMGRSDGLFIRIASTCCIDLLDLTLEQNNALPQLTEVPTLAVAYNSDGSMLASGGEDSHVKLWSITREKQLSLGDLVGHTDAVTDVVFSPDGRLLVSSSLDGTMRLWNIETQQELAVLSEPENSVFRAIAFSPDGTLIATAGSDGIVRLWGVGKFETTAEVSPTLAPQITEPSPTSEIAMIPTIENPQTEIVQVLNAGDITGETVVIRNISNNIISLQGWTLRDNSDNVYEFPDYFLLASSTLNIATGVGTDFPSQLYWNRDETVWEVGDMVRLFDAQGNLQSTLVIQ